MTIALPEGNLPGVADGFSDGLGDLDFSDLQIPRLKIAHIDAKFEDNLSGERYSEVDVIILGLVKQRVNFDPEVDEGDKPLCKSPDNKHGFPLLIPVNGKQFDWENSNFNREDYETPDGKVMLPCATCVFATWGEKDSKTGKRKPPSCAEQYTLPILYGEAGTDPQEFSPALITFQKTGIKPTKAYLSSFMHSRRPGYAVVTRLGLTQMTRGQVKYCVPVFTKGAPTDHNMWPEYSNQYHNMRDFVTKLPTESEDEVELIPSKVVESTAATPAATPTTQASAPAQAAAAPAAAKVAVPDYDEEPPF